jgi:3-oxoacyl-[acyl-carrier protein] reductase
VKGEKMAKTVLITGGNKGIGLVTTKKFLDNGFKVIVIGRDFEKFPYKENENVQIITYDLANVKGIRELVGSLGEIDVLVNNAAISKAGTYIDYKEEDMQAQFDVDLRAPVELVAGLAEQFIQRGSGRIVNVASQAAEIGYASNIWYGIVKAGLINFTTAIATDLGRKGIIVNAVSPGPVKTGDYQAFLGTERAASVRGRTYEKREARPEEIAEVIYWLGTTSPAYLNGENIDVNNGVQKMNL